MNATQLLQDKIAENTLALKEMDEDNKAATLILRVILLFVTGIGISTFKFISSLLI